MPAWILKGRHVAGHLFRWAWLIGLYVVIVSYTFGAIGAWQFHDRIREVAGDRPGTNAIRQQLVSKLRESHAAQTALDDRLGRLDGSLGAFGQYVADLNSELATDPGGQGQFVPVKDIAPEVLDRVRSELPERILALQADLAAFKEGAPPAHLNPYLMEIGAYLRGDDSQQPAVTLLAEYLTADDLRSWVATPFFYVPGQEHVPRQLATWSEGHLTLLLTLLMGALGSLLYVSRAYLGWAFKGARLSEPAPLPLSWFILRPMFGMITALAILILIKAGQLGFSSGTTFSLEEGSVNPFLIGFIAIIAGLMSWQCLELIESVGERWLRSAQRRDLWATGLRNALAVRARTARALAEQVGRSQRQVERWMLFRDKVIPEMQDRIATWLKATRTELFGDELPQPLPERPPLRATEALKTAGLDAAGLARQLGASAEEVKAWLAGSKPVPPAAQDAIADALGRPIAELFEAPPAPQAPVAAPPPPAAGGATPTPAPASGDAAPAAPQAAAPLKLDRILAERQLSAEALSAHLQVDPETVRKWIAGEAPVPTDTRARIAARLGVEEDTIAWG